MTTRSATFASRVAALRRGRRLLPAGVGRVLEIGAGLGAMGALLARRYEYVGLEPDPASCEVARRRIGAGPCPRSR